MVWASRAAVAKHYVASGVDTAASIESASESAAVESDEKRDVCELVAAVRRLLQRIHGRLRVRTYPLT